LKFKKPPVVEAWIAFKLDLSEESTKWDEDRAQLFIKENFEDFKIEGCFGFSKLFIDNKTHNIDPDKTQIIFDRIRAFTEQKDYCVQAGRNILVFNQINKERWPEYEAMRDRAIDALNKYMDFRDLHKLSSVSLHYRDIISIPKGENNLIELKDFFKVHPELPKEHFGALSGFSLSAQLGEIGEKAITNLTLHSLPQKDPSDDNAKFIMDWHVTSIEKFDNLDFAVKWLNKAHKDLKDGFESAFTEKCLNLFEPEGSK